MDNYFAKQHICKCHAGIDKYPFFKNMTANFFFLIFHRTIFNFNLKLFCQNHNRYVYAKIYKGEKSIFTFNN